MHMLDVCCRYLHNVQSYVLIHFASIKLLLLDVRHFEEEEDEHHHLPPNNYNNLVKGSSMRKKLQNSKGYADSQEFLPALRLFNFNMTSVTKT